MPGETLDDALTAAQNLGKRNIATILTHLGENISDRDEAHRVTEHYLDALARIHDLGGDVRHPEISVKLTQLGLDLDPELCFANLYRMISHEERNSIVWIDMESSAYVERSLAIYRRAKAIYANVGICLQAYLHRTQDDLAALLPLCPAIRLVKGAYNEPPDVAFSSKADVDHNYFVLARQMLQAQKSGNCCRAAFGTHDVVLIRRLADMAASLGIPADNFEVQMLYGIQRAEQERLARQGHRSVVLVAYGLFWYPWFVRRLAERPANLWFMLRNLFAI
jgi:proline dehydrogenase